MIFSSSKRVIPKMFVLFCRTIAGGRVFAQSRRCVSAETMLLALCHSYGVCAFGMCHRILCMRAGYNYVPWNNSVNIPDTMRSFPSPACGTLSLHQYPLKKNVSVAGLLEDGVTAGTAVRVPLSLLAYLRASTFLVYLHTSAVLSLSQVRIRVEHIEPNPCRCYKNGHTFAAHCRRRWRATFRWVNRMAWYS